MARLRIEIAGQVFEADLALEPLVVGRAAEAGISIAAEGVADEHCVLEPLPDGRWKVRDLGGLVPTRRNGAVVRQAALAHGDVLDVGPARIVFLDDGAGPVVAVGPPAAVAGPVRGVAGTARAAEEAQRSKRPLVAAALLVVGLAALAIVLAKGKGGSAEDPRHVELRALVEGGRHAEARSLLDVLVQEGGEPTARALAGVRHRLDAEATSLETALAGIWSGHLELSPAMRIERKADIERRFGDAGRSRFAELEARMDAAAAEWLAERKAELEGHADHHRRRHEYKAWRDRWRLLARIAPAAVDAEALVADAVREVEAAAAAAAVELEAEVERLLAKQHGFEATLLLEARVPGFAGFPARERLEHLLRLAREEKSRPHASATAGPRPAVSAGSPESAPAEAPTHAPTEGPVSPATLAGEAAAQQLAADAVAKRAFGSAAALLDERALALPLGPERAAHEALAADLRRAASALTAIVGAIAQTPAKFRGLAISERLRVDATAADAEGFDGAIREGSTRFLWARLAAAAFDSLLERVAPQGAGAYDAACLVRAVDPSSSAADRWLVRAGTSGFELPALFHTLARWRREAVPSEGYVVFGARYVAPAERERLLREEAIQLALADVDAAKPAKRKEAWDRLFELGPAAHDRFREALLRRRRNVRDEIAASPRWTGERVAARLFAELEKRRAHALALIRDEAAYPYPNPDGRGQAEVDERVAAVREMWESPAAVVLAEDESLRASLDVLTEVDAALSRLDPRHETSLEDLIAAASLRIDMPNHTPNASAAKLRERSRAVLEFNRRVPTTTTAQERENVDAVNEYRMMMGLAAVKIHELLVRAARGHSRHMRENGYFEHDVPAGKGDTPTNRTPAARAKAQGYGGGVGENIAAGVATGRDAFRAWYSSSGHHRNMVGAGWTEMGCGTSKRTHWTQLFGAMTGPSLDPPGPWPDPAPYYAPDE